MTLSHPFVALADVLRRAGEPLNFERWAAQVAGAGYCRHPIRLAGRIDLVQPATGELAALLDTAAEPDGVLLVACENRRATVCPSCAATYRSDAWHLIAAGLRGGKGVSDTIAAHPRAFVTLTAPSFGRVHSRREDRKGRVRRCHPRPDDLGYCPHSRPTTCTLRHAESDPLLGQPICAECFDYESAVLFNAHVTQLWQTTIRLARLALARRLGVTVRRLHQELRLSFGKVAEYQARGVIHLHAVARLDGAGLPGEPPSPPRGVDTEDLVAALAAAAQRAEVSVGGPHRQTVHWGAQLDLRPIPTRFTTAEEPAIEAVAGYLAKYATKSTDANGALDHPVRSAAEIRALCVSPHLRRMVETCWRLGAEPAYAHLKLRRWAHSLGFRGHLTTKSLRYSTTFTALRGARRAHARRRDGSEVGEAWQPVSTLRYAGSGYTTTGDACLAETAHNCRVEARRLAREDRSRTAAGGPPGDPEGSA